MSFRWSFTSHSGNWREGKAYKSGWTNTHPLKCYLAEGKRKGVLPESGHSFLSTNSDNVICSTIKPAESNGEGYILRFFETSGKQTTLKTKLAFGFQIASVIETNLIEVNKQKELNLINNNSFEIDIAGVNADLKLNVVGECKWSDKKVGLSVYKELQSKIKSNKLPIAPNCRYLLFSKSGFSADLENEAKKREQPLFDQQPISKFANKNTNYQRKITF